MKEAEVHIQHGASVVVTDGSKALFLRNEGDADFPHLRVTRKWEQDLPATHQLGSSAPGHFFTSHGGASRRSAYDEADLHEQAKVEFTSAVADFLNEQGQAGSIEELIIVAPPRTLAVLRKKLRRELASRVTAEIDSDLVKHPIEAIERLLCAQPEQTVRQG